MNGKKVVYQRPCPKVVIKAPDSGNTKLTFSLSDNKNLLSYQYSLSVNDISGSFSLTFFPEYKDGRGNSKSLYDEIDKLDIVEIYEVLNSESSGWSEEDTKWDGSIPTFTGIVKTKKYVAQANDQGGLRRFSISGCSIAGLVSQFYINLDVAAQALTEEIAADKAIGKELTTNLLGSYKEAGAMKKIIIKIWENFLKIAEQNGTPKVAEYITQFMGGADVFFDVGDIPLNYPIGCVFGGQQTQDFFSILDSIIPSPYYEKFAYTDGETGKMKIKIRKVPFLSKDWTSLSKHFLNASEVKSFDLTESDSEVYTVFYAYLNGYAIDEHKALVLSTMDTKKETVLESNEKLYKTYGYRPLIIHYLGYTKEDGKEDSKTDLSDVSKELKEMYENVQDMLSGSITIAMTNKNAHIQPGERVSFLTGDFYVEGISHTWNYGSGGEINISVSRGGSYFNGKFYGKIKNLSQIIKIFQEGNALPTQPFSWRR